MRRSWDDKEGVIETKSRAGTRTVPIATVLRGHLLAHHLRHGRPTTGARLRPHRHPAVLTLEPASPGSAPGATRSREPLTPIGLHECRHTFASLMIAAGVNAKALSTYIGHSSIQITLDRYGHLMPGNEQEAAAAARPLPRRARTARLVIASQLMKRRQFNDAQRTQAIDLIESLPWGDVGEAIRGLEVALALALEAVGDAVDLWEEEGEERFGGEFQLSADQVASLDHEWRLAYIGRLLRTAAYAYGVPPHGTPGRRLRAT